MPWFNQELFFWRWCKFRSTQFRQSGDSVLRRRKNFRFPCQVKEVNTEQFGLVGNDLLLYCQQRRKLNVVRMQLDLDQRVVKELKPDEAEVLHREQRRVVIRIGIAQRRQKLGAVLEHPPPVGRDQHGKAFHESPRKIKSQMFYTSVGDGSR